MKGIRGRLFCVCVKYLRRRTACCSVASRSAGQGTHAGGLAQLDLDYRCSVTRPQELRCFVHIGQKEYCASEFSEQLSIDKARCVVVQIDVSCVVVIVSPRAWGAAGDTPPTSGRVYNTRRHVTFFAIKWRSATSVKSTDCSVSSSSCYCSIIIVLLLH